MSRIRELTRRVRGTAGSPLVVLSGVVWLGGSLLLGGGFSIQAAVVEVRLLERTLDAGGGRVAAPGVSVDGSLGGLGTVVVSSDQPAVRLHGGLPGRLDEPPAAPDQIWHRPVKLAMKRRVNELLAAVTDAEGETLELVQVGPPLLPAFLRMDNGWVLYAPSPAGGEDQFPYVVTDSAGGRAVGTVYVLMEPAGPGITQNQVGAPTLLPDGRWLLRFLGIPGRTYLLQYTDRLGDPWQPLPGMPAPWRAPADGLLEAVDHGGAVRARFYRVLLF